MSSHDLSHIVALSCKALELEIHGHYARAVEKSAAAIAAAEELAQEDCLVVTHMQLLHVNAQIGYADTAGVAGKAAEQATNKGSQMLVAAIATLERRRTGGRC